MHIVGLKFLFLNAIKILYHMWCDIFFLYFFFFCEKQIMRVDKVRLSWFILLNSYSLKKEKEKKWSYTFKKKRKVKYKPTCVYVNKVVLILLIYQINSYILKNRSKKSGHIFSGRKEKNREVNYAIVSC